MMADEQQQVFLNAVQQGSLKDLERLAAGHPEFVQQAGPAGISPLMTAIYYRQTQATAWLLDHGAEPGPFEAAALGLPELLANHLQQQPALVSAHAADGFTLLGLASFFGQPGCVQLLLESGADPNQPASNPTRVAPLHSACAGVDPQQRLAVVRQLLEHAADPNARQQRGFTPLHAAAQNGDVPLIQLLLDFGADPAQQDETGKAPVDYAQEHVAAARLLDAARS